MKKYALWLVLGTMAFGLGGLCYWLLGQNRIADVICIATMAALTLWFIAGDMQVDEVFEADRRRAEHEAKQWEHSYKV